MRLCVFSLSIWASAPFAHGHRRLPAAGAVSMPVSREEGKKEEHCPTPWNGGPQPQSTALSLGQDWLPGLSEPPVCQRSWPSLGKCSGAREEQGWAGSDPSADASKQVQPAGRTLSTRHRLTRVTPEVPQGSWQSAGSGAGLQFLGGTKQHTGPEGWYGGREGIPLAETGYEVEP